MSHKIRVYVAGKVSKNSSFGTHYWRDEFVEKLSELSGLEFINFDPTKKETDQNYPEKVFGADTYMISQSDVMIIYLSDDVSVGASQEILIAKYFKKPVIGLAPAGGKFNHKNKEIFGQKIKYYSDPFVYSTCDVVCETIEEIAIQLKNLNKIQPKNINVIKELSDKFAAEELSSDSYLSGLFNNT